MSEEDKGVKSDSSTDQNKGSKVDERGVSWENVAREYERKFKEVSERQAQMEQYLASQRQPSAEESAEDVRMKVLQQFATDPDGFVQTQVKRAMYAEQTTKALEWVKSQEGYQPDDDKALASIIREYGLNAPPLKKAEAAWNLFRNMNPQRFQKKVEQADNRDKELQRFQVAGPGRVGPIHQSDERKAILNKMLNAGSDRERASLLGALDELSAKERSKK